MPAVIRINRGLTTGRYHLVDIFPEIAGYSAVADIFDDDSRRADVLANTNVWIADRRGYMMVDNETGAIRISKYHLRDSEDTILYLDIIHELCHVKQHLQGLDLFDRAYVYVDRPTEIDAYRVTVKEARRMGLSDKAFLDYLWVEWITPEEHKRLARHLGVKAASIEKWRVP